MCIFLGKKQFKNKYKTYNRKRLKLFLCDVAYIIYLAKFNNMKESRYSNIYSLKLMIIGGVNKGCRDLAMAIGITLKFNFALLVVKTVHYTIFWFNDIVKLLSCDIRLVTLYEKYMDENI